MRISDWSSDVCSSDLARGGAGRLRQGAAHLTLGWLPALAHGPVQAQRSGTCEHEIEEHEAVEHRGLAHVEGKIGRASCRERVCQYVLISVVAGSLQKKQKRNSLNTIQAKSEKK